MSALEGDHALAGSGLDLPEQGFDSALLVDDFDYHGQLLRDGPGALLEKRAVRPQTEEALEDRRTLEPVDDAPSGRSICTAARCRAGRCSTGGSGRALARRRSSRPSSHVSQVFATTIPARTATSPTMTLATMLAVAVSHEPSSKSA